MAKDPICGMDIDETSSLKLTKGAEVYYFCSEHCLKKFAAGQRIDEREPSGCLATSRIPWYKNKNFIVALALLTLVIFSYTLPFLEPFRKTLAIYVRKIWWAILLGLILGGIIDYYVPREYISHILAKPKKRTIFYAVILGFFMSACSHGILALSIELHKKGASNSAVVSFLLASPWENLVITAMFIGFFGPVKALYIILCALLVAVTTGLAYQLLESRGAIEVNKNTRITEEGFSIRKDMVSRIKAYKISGRQLVQDLKGVYSGSISLGDMVVWWILIGMGLASAAGAYIPQHIFKNYMGPTVIGMIVTLIVATILEVCSEGTAPLAFEIYRQTKAVGNSFVFLMAGVVTDYTEIGLLWANVGRRVALWLPIVTVPQVIAWGLLANILFKGP